MQVLKYWIRANPKRTIAALEKLPGSSCSLQHPQQHNLHKESKCNCFAFTMYTWISQICAQLEWTGQSTWNITCNWLPTAGRRNVPKLALASLAPGRIRWAVHTCKVQAYTSWKESWSCKPSQPDDISWSLQVLTEYHQTALSQNWHELQRFTIYSFWQKGKNPETDRTRQLTCTLSQFNSVLYGSTSRHGIGKKSACVRKASYKSDLS